MPQSTGIFPCPSGRRSAMIFSTRGWSLKVERERRRFVSFSASILCKVGCKRSRGCRQFSFHFKPPPPGPREDHRRPGLTVGQVKALFQNSRRSGPLAGPWRRTLPRIFAQGRFFGGCRIFAARTAGAAPFFPSPRACSTTQNREKMGLRKLCPLSNIASQPGRSSSSSTRCFSEEAVLGFEDGYSTSEPNELRGMWEAQFGDFANRRAGRDRPVHSPRARS